MKTKVRVRFISLFVIITILFTGFAIPVSASTTGTKMRYGIDYSGQGTVIEGEIIKDESSQVCGNDLLVPVWHGKYEPRSCDWWWLHSFSDWSVNNNKTNPNFTSYNGSDTATEYDVESRTEYKYSRYEEQPKYESKYYTYYIGTAWYNKGRKKTVSSWDGYSSNIKDYKIDHYEVKKEKHGTQKVKVYSDWVTEQPSNWPWDEEWQLYNTITTYRYRSRTLKWNKQSYSVYERCPMNYSLYDECGTPIQNGITWSFNEIISGKDSRFSCYDQLMISDGKVYYLTLKDAILHLEDEIDLIKDSFGDLEWIGFVASAVECFAGDKIDLGGLLTRTSEELFALGLVESAESPEAKVISKYIALYLLVLEIEDYALGKLRDGDIGDILDTIKEIKYKYMDINKVLVIEYSEYFTYCAGECVDMTFSLSVTISDITAVSMDASRQRFGSSIGYGKKHYGTVSYGVNIDDISDDMDTYLTYMYPMSLIWDS